MSACWAQSGLDWNDPATMWSPARLLCGCRVATNHGRSGYHFGHLGDLSVGTGIVGSPACGDVMKLQIRVDEDCIIQDAKFKTYGCGSAIASSSLLTEWVKGKSLTEASLIKNSDIAEELALPPVKIHCSVLAEDAITAAIEDYKSKRK